MSNINVVMNQAAAASVTPVWGWDLSYAYYDPPESLTWDLSNSAFVSRRFSVSSQTTSPVGVFFKPDGSKMYVLSNGVPQGVKEYNLSTNWDVNSAVYIQALTTSTQDTSPSSLFFKPDGTKMYITGKTNDRVYEYDLSTAWDISSASINQNFSVSSQDTNPHGIFFKPDGTKMYVTGWTGQDLNEYDLSTAWDISTASYLQNFSFSSQDTAPRQISFSPDGTTMFMVGITNDNIYQYSLSTGWDISTASYIKLRSISADEINAWGLFVSSDGKYLYTTGSSSDYVNQYALGLFSIQAQESDANGLSFKPDGTKMYIVGRSGDDVNEYDLTTAWDTSTASFLQAFSVAAQETTPHDLFFKPDGMKMYIVGQTGDDVNEYSLSTAWDVSSASYSQAFSIAAQEINPQGLFFKSDGAKMYVCGSTGDDVNEYNLSIAWDVSTASYSQAFSVVAQDTDPEALFFKPDGTKMYILGGGGTDVNEYTLSTAWDISTATYSQAFLVGSQGNSPRGLFFKEDGTQMFITGGSQSNFHTVTSYTISV